MRTVEVKPKTKPPEPTEENCANCRFWLARSPNGICRRFPPIVFDSHGMNTQQHPEVSAQHWCGEWKGK